jgi:hypothetical protein
MRTAIVIAANGPEGSRDRLKFAESDGDRFAKALEQPPCAYEVRRVSGETHASEVRDIVLEAAEECRPSDVFLTTGLSSFSLRENRENSPAGGKLA